MTNSCVYFLGFLCMFTCSTSAIRVGKTEVDARWCVAQTGAPDDKLQGFIDYACGVFDCAAIQPGGACYEPNNLQNHASYALDLNFRNNGNCDSEIGTPSVADPSFGDCHYP